MTTQRDDVLDRVAGLLEPTPEALPNFHRRMRRHHRSRQIGAYAMVAAMVAIAVVVISIVGNGPTPRVPADDPTPTEGLGIFGSVAGWIAYQDVAGLWAIDPDTLQDPMEVQLDSADARPLGWSRDGTELLIVRTTRPIGPGLGELLSILHADGSETPVTTDPMDISGATFSPDGSQVVFAGRTERGSALYRVDAHAGPAELFLEHDDATMAEPTFSPDGTQIAYIVGAGDHSHHVWVMNADGSDAHEIVFNQSTEDGHVSRMHLAWSPVGDRIALGSVDDAIFTFAPDGSEFTRVIPGGSMPYWSPDGSQIAYTTGETFRTEDGNTIPWGLAIADADGSNVREFGSGASGPWHPGG